MRCVGSAKSDWWFGRYCQQIGQNGVPKKITRNIILTEKIQMTNIISNFDTDNIVFGTEVLAHHPEELPLEIWEFTNLHWVL